MLFNGRGNGGERTRFRANVEAMEGRAMLTASGATILLSNGMVEVLGTSLGDTGSVSIQGGNVLVQVSNSQGGDNVAFPASQVRMIDYVGGAGNNTFTNATGLTAYLNGGAGNNVLNGGSGVDFLIANGAGNNVLNAGSGYEVLESFGTGHNVLNGGAGTDTMYAISGTNAIHAGNGSTTVVTYGGTNTVDVAGGACSVYSFDKTDVVTPSSRTHVFHFGY